MFACEETVDDEDDNHHNDYHDEDCKCGCACPGVKVDRIDIEDRVVTSFDYLVESV